MGVKSVGNCFKQKAKMVWIWSAIAIVRFPLLLPKNTAAHLHIHTYSIQSLNLLLAYPETCLPTAGEKLKQIRMNAIHNQFIYPFLNLENILLEVIKIHIQRAMLEERPGSNGKYLSVLILHPVPFQGKLFCINVSQCLWLINKIR